MPYEKWGQEMQGKAPNPIDKIVGQNIRFQRIQKGISQEALANRLGITFQQVQKYEKGANRTSASRLAQIASVLGIGIIELFDGVANSSASADSTITQLVESPDAIELLQAFDAVKNKKTRTAVIDLVLQIATS
jgi:transcriptional regulator with XRE-family HTH domain